MIKIFFSHVCNNEKSHAFLDWLSEKIRRDLKEFEPFIACRTRSWNDASDLNDHLDESHFFVPTVTEEFPTRPNCNAELKRSRERKESTGSFPVIIPIRFGCQSETMEALGFRIDQEASTGELWIDFSDSTDWESKYEEFRERLAGTASRLKLLGSQSFYQDAEHLDIILKRDKPTAFEVKSAIDLCRRGEEYANYFFRRLKNKEWISHLKAFRFFQGNPDPVEDPKQRGYFAIPFWPVVDYLEAVSKECEKPENRELALEIMQIIREVTRPKDAKKADNYRTWWYFIKIMANLPTDVITLEDIDLLGEWVASNFSTTLVGDELGKTFLPKLLASNERGDWNKAAKVVEIITRIRWVERKYGDSVERVGHAAIDLYWLRELFKKNAFQLGERCRTAVVGVLKARVQEVVNSKDRYSYVWRPAIESHHQNIGQNDVRNMFISALRDVLLGYSKSSDEEVKQVLRALLHDDLCVLKRLGLFTLGERFEIHGELFWEVLSPALFDSNLAHELYNLLAKNFKNFPPERQNQVLDIIENLARDWRKDEDKALLDARLRLKWLHSLKGQGSDEADKLYEAYLGIAKSPPEHPEFAAYVQGGVVPNTPPCSVDELLSKSVSEIVEYLNVFKESGEWRAPTEEGLGETLKEAVKRIPAKFEDELGLFLKARQSYSYYLLRALEELWGGRNPINWEKTLKFCLAIIESKGFQEAADEKQVGDLAPTRSWITSAICSLIEAGVKNDEWAFDEQYLDLAESIITQILENEPPTVKEDSADYFGHAINTPKGRSIEALFNYALRKVRLLSKRNEDRMPFWKHIQPLFDRELELCMGSNFEFSALAGAYLPNLLYLSNPWTEKNIDRIFSDNHELNWQAAMHGYAYVNTVYQEIYKLLKEHGHFGKALQSDVTTSQVREKIIQNICIGYLEGWDDLEAGLFGELIRDWREHDVSEVIRCFWMLREADLKEEARRRILNFWGHCYEKLKGQEEANGQILSNLSLLTEFLADISANQKEWLLQAAPYVDENHNSSFFLEYLDQLTQANPEAVAEIMLRMLTRTAPPFNEEHVRSIVEKLYMADLKNQANGICDGYARSGNQALREVYEKYNR